MHVLQSSYFKKRLKRIPRPIRHALAERLALFRSNRTHPLLNDHALTGDRLGERSINITGDWRLIYTFIAPDTAYLLDVDTHHNLYGS